MPIIINQLDPELEQLVRASPTQWNYWLDASRVKSVLAKIYGYIRNLNGFVSGDELPVFLNFLKAFIKTKPNSALVLKEFNNILRQITENVIILNTIDSYQHMVAINFLTLLKTMMDPDHRYLFSKKEINWDASDLKNLALSLFKSSNFSSDQFDIYALLKASFDSSSFLNNYRILRETTLELANNTKLSPVSIKEVENALETLGYLGRVLKYYHKQNNLGFRYSLIPALKDINDHSTTLYEIFSDSHNFSREFLDYIFFKKFVSVIMQDDIPKLDPIHRCKEYSNHCQIGYHYFKLNYTCPYGNSKNYDIYIEHNKLTSQQLLDTCMSMRQTETAFSKWQQKIGLQAININSSFILRVSDSRDDFSFNTLFLENYELKSNVIGVYFYKSKGKHTHLIFGIAYSDGLASLVPEHEYMHQLVDKAVNPWSFKMLTEGIPEVFAGGVCHPTYLGHLNPLSNDTNLWRSLRNETFSGYFDAFKFSAYLINEKEFFLKQLLTSFQNKDRIRFDLDLKKFINDPTQETKFMDWTRSQAAMCTEYQEKNPNFKKSSIYLTALHQPLITTRKFVVPFQKKKTWVTPTIEDVTMSTDDLARDVSAAIIQRDARKVERLLSLGANIHWRDPYNNETFLGFMFNFGIYSYEITQLLINNGADVCANINGITPYKMLLELSKGHSEGIKKIDDLIVKLNPSVQSHSRIIQEEISRLQKFKLEAKNITTLIPLLNQSPTFSESRCLLGQVSSTDRPNITTIELNSKPTQGSISSSSSTAITPYNPTPPCEYTIIVQLSTNVAKGFFTAISRYGFEKMFQNPESFVRQHPWFSLAIKSFIDALTITSLDFFSFSSNKGRIQGFNDITTIGIYFGVDCSMSLICGYAISYVQQRLNLKKARNWIMMLGKYTSIGALYTLFFLLSNLSFLLGEKYQDCKSEIVLHYVINAVLASICHKAFFYGINSLDRCIPTMTRSANSVVANPEAYPLIDLTKRPISKNHVIFSETFNALQDELNILMKRIEKKPDSTQFNRSLFNQISYIERTLNLKNFSADPTMLLHFSIKLNRLQTNVKGQTFITVHQKLHTKFTACIEALNEWMILVNTASVTPVRSLESAAGFQSCRRLLDTNANVAVSKTTFFQQGPPNIIALHQGLNASNSDSLSANNW